MPPTSPAASSPLPTPYSGVVESPTTEGDEDPEGTTISGFSEFSGSAIQGVCGETWRIEESRGKDCTAVQSSFLRRVPASHNPAPACLDQEGAIQL
jgi:hypothetical protein